MLHRRKNLKTEKKNPCFKGLVKSAMVAFFAMFVFERLKLALSLFFLCADTSEKLWHSSVVELILTNTERNIDIKTYYKNFH